MPNLLEMTWGAVILSCVVGTLAIKAKPRLWKGALRVLNNAYAVLSGAAWGLQLWGSKTVSYIFLFFPFPRRGGLLASQGQHSQWASIPSHGLTQSPSHLLPVLDRWNVASFTRSHLGLRRRAAKAHPHGGLVTVAGEDRASPHLPTTKCPSIALLPVSITG